MSAVCSCIDPKVVRVPGKEACCSRCGHWYMPQHGSMPEGIPSVNLEMRWRDTIAANLPSKIGRNDACFCGSGRKFKKCHGGVKL